MSLTISRQMDAVPVLLRGEPEPINEWVRQWENRRVLFYAGMIGMGAGLFGLAVGWWHAPRQAVYTAVKLPFLLLLTAAGNALLNGMLAPLLGLDLRFRQSFQAILMSFAIAAVVLGSFSPLVFFVLWNTPSITTAGGGSAYSVLLLSQTGVIAFAGVAANLRLIQLLARLSGSARVAKRLLFSWLAGNLLLGSQLAWILRPFVGSPGLPVEFLRPNAFQGNFYETVFGILRQFWSA